jgi:translation initiation factor 2B subunit (eIF-2B alpha/beta/delta family)
VIPDATVYSVLAGVDVIIVGADAISGDMVINKVGTAVVALAARERGVPAWVLCSSTKFARPDWKPKLGHLFEATPRGWFTGLIDDT